MNEKPPSLRNRIWVALQLAYAGFRGLEVQTAGPGHYKVWKNTQKCI